MRSSTVDRTGSAVVTLPSDTEIKIERKFDAPAELVFDVWTIPEHIRNWWGFPEHEMTVCEMDLSVGGSYRFAAMVQDEFFRASGPADPEFIERAKAISIDQGTT